MPVTGIDRDCLVFSTSISSQYFVQEALKTLRKLDDNEVSNPGGIPVIVLRNCALEVFTVLAHLSRLSLNLRSPENLEACKCTAYTQERWSCDPSNYQPIAISSVLC